MEEFDWAVEKNTAQYPTPTQNHPNPPNFHPQIRTLAPNDPFEGLDWFALSIW